MNAGKLRDVAIESALESGKLLLNRFGSDFEVRRKGQINLVTEMDLLSEQRIAEIIGSHFPDHQILAEENRYPTRNSSYKWIIDPLDGTTNYAHGYPMFSVSIAVECDGQIILGVVYQPVLNELFVAEKGEGATLNQKKISVSKTETLANGLLSTGFPYDMYTSKENNLNYFAKFCLRAQAVRRDGSAAIDMCYVAAGRFDGFWELKLSPWDTAAGTLMIREAGGTVTDFSGNPFDIYGGRVAASNGKIHDEMIQVLAEGSALFDP